MFLKGVSIKVKFEWFFFSNFTIPLTVKLLSFDVRYDNINFVTRCARYCTCKDLGIKWHACVCSFKRGNRERSIKTHFPGAVPLTYLLTKERGIKCCNVDISSEQSNIQLTPLNWRTRHGAELVLPKEYWKKKYRKPPKRTWAIFKALNFEMIAVFSYQLHIMSWLLQKFV